MSDPIEEASKSLAVWRGDHYEPNIEIDELARLKQSHGELLAALKVFMEMLTDGRLVRDITRDGESSFSLRMVDFVRELNKAQQAIRNGEAICPPK
jgi:hypothetical protein